MRQFDFYEFAGILAPGATLLFGAALLVPQAGILLRSNQGLTIGDLGIFAIVAYVAGHLVQAFGNALEFVWWKLWGGWPTDWPRINRHDLVSVPQREQLRTAISGLLNLPEQEDAFSIPKKQWPAIVRQIDARVQTAGKTQRIEIFNGNYGLNRGIAAALFSLALLALLIAPSDNWKAALGCAVLGAIAIYRMHRFGRHYGREVFIQFLQAEGPKQE